jgi:RND family efflux transporter MFP subunit
MKRWLKWIAAVVLIALLAAGVLRALSARKASKEALEAQQAMQKTQASLALSAKDIVAVRMLELTQGLEISGPLKAVNSAFVKAKVAGELQGMTLREGDYVKAGQVLGRVDPSEYLSRTKQAQQQAQSAKAQVEIAQRSFDNNRSLVEQGFISKTALETSASSLASAQANFQAAQAAADVAGKSLEDTFLRAPIAGQIAQRLAQPGERVAIEARILEVVDLSRLELEANLSAADSMAVKVGQTARLTVEGAPQPLTAKVARINPSAVAGSRAVLAYLSLDSSLGLRQGLFAQGLLATGAARALALPLSAVRTDKPQPYVQLIKDGKVVHATVTIGARGEAQGQTMVAIGNITEGAEVISGTVGPVREGTLVKRNQGAK